MLIDEFLPDYDVVERHSVEVQAPSVAVYRAVRDLDLSESRIVRWLMAIRGLPALLKPKKRRPELRLTLDGLLESGFVILGERPRQELLLGTVGRFWTPSGGAQQVGADAFRHFATPGYAKAVWSFYVSEQPDGTTQLVTETRVRCLDGASRRRFRLYWLFVRPFSGLIGKMVLRGIKRKAEASLGQA